MFLSVPFIQQVKGPECCLELGLYSGYYGGYSRGYYLQYSQGTRMMPRATALRMSSVTLTLAVPSVSKRHGHLEDLRLRCVELRAKTCIEFHSLGAGTWATSRSGRTLQQVESYLKVTEALNFRICMASRVSILLLLLSGCSGSRALEFLRIAQWHGLKTLSP